MPYIQLDDKQFPLRVGEARVGGPGAEIPLPFASPAAVVQCAAPDQVFIRRGREDADVRVNGVRLGAEPTPLFHGDKIEIEGRELLFGDDRRSGSTQFLLADEIQGRLGRTESVAEPRAAAHPTASTGGRLVSLVDGREYAVPAGGATIGRDAGCDVVVASGDVSRRHAELAPAAGGYLLRDLSTNGVCVNDERIDGPRYLGRGDVLRVGAEEFRFYADAAEAAPAPPAAPPLPRPVFAPSLADTAMRPAVADSRPLLATLEIINQGVLRGRRYEIRAALAHVGRGPHNDIVVADDSVSETHAKLQKRDAGWFVVDMDSTNGTYVAGKRIRGEQRLHDAGDVRFGGVKMAFSPATAVGPDAGGTRAIAGAAAAASRVGRKAAPPAVRSSGGVSRRSPWIWALGLAVAGGAALLWLRQGR